MASLTGCLKKAGKALSTDDAKAIRQIYNDHIADNVSASEAADRAIGEYLAILELERGDIVSQIERAGGNADLAKGGILYAAADRVTEIARNLSIVDNLYRGKALEGLDKKKNNTREFAKYLSKRARKANRGKPLSARTSRNKDIISEVLAQETMAAMKQTGHAGTWYSDTLRDAVSIAGLVHPEIYDDAGARTAFIFAIAITSNGASVEENTKHAEEMYREYKQLGRFPIKGYGTETGAMKKAFQLFNDLKEKWGMDSFVKFMHTEFTVGELDLLGMKVNGENTDTRVYGSAIFGPKIGQGFYQNLSGNFEPLTMDRWWMRTWGRIVGNLAPEGMQDAQRQADNLRAVLPDYETKVNGMGYSVDELLESDTKLAKFAYRVHREYATGGFKDRNPLNRAAKVFDTALNEPVVAPRNGAERTWIREVSDLAKEKLKDRGTEVDTASMQALLWYPEKQFYLTNGVGNERAKPTDYAKEFAKLAKARGFDQSRIDATVARRGSRRTAAGVESSGKPSGQEGRGATAAVRQQLLHSAAARKLRDISTGAFSRRVPTGSQRTVDVARVANVHKLGVAAKNVLAKAGLAAPEFYELESSEEAGQVFAYHVAKAAASSKAGSAIRVLPAEEYEMMRTFMTPDGSAGFALNGDEVVSVYKDAESPYTGVSQALMRLAVEQGGRRVTTFDTAAPHLYAMQGFRAVARSPFVKPKGWVKRQFKEYQGGEPDQVFMIYDNDSSSYDRSDGEMFDSYVDAAVKQMDSAADQEPRNYPKKKLRYRLEDEPSPIVEQQPSNPLSQITKISATMEDQLRHGVNGGRTLREALSDLAVGRNASNLEHVLGAIPRRNLRDFVSRGSMPAVDEYVRLANRMDGRRNELLLKQEEIAKRWTTLVSRNKPQGRVLGELMHAATLSGVDPSKDYTPHKAPSKMTPEEKALDAKRHGDWRILKKWWDSLDQEAREIFTSVRDSYSTQRQSVEVALMARINAAQADPGVKRSLMTELRKKFEQGRVTGPYFPLARFGELWASAKDSEGNTVAFSRFEHLSEQKEWMGNFRDAGYEVDGGKKQDDMAIVKRMDPGFVANVTALAAKSDKGLADEIWQMYLKHLPEMSMRKAFLHRKNRLGFTTDAIRSFGHNMFHGSHQLAKLEFMHQMDSKLDEMRDQSRKLEKDADPEALWGNAVYREMVRRHEWARNPTSKMWATKLTSLGFAWYLGTTPAAAVVNLSQTAIVGAPVLAAKFSWAGATAELLKASALYAGSWGPMANRLRGDERKAMDEAARIGLFDKTQAHDLAGLSEEGIDYSSMRHKTMQIVSWLFHKAEEFNRQVTFLAGYRLGRAAGMSHNDAVVTAEDLTWDSHFDYNNVNRPRYLQSDAAKVVLLFRQYSLNMTYRLSRDFNDSVRGANPEVRKAARTRFGGIMGMTGLFAGATGLPMFWLAEVIVNAIAGDEDEPYDFVDNTRAHLAQTFSPELADVVMKGPFDALTGITLSSRVSLNNLWVREAPANLEGADLWMHYIGEFVGPIPSIARDVGFKAPQEFSEGNYHRALEHALPKFLKDYAKTYRYLQEGVQNRRGDDVVPRDEITSLDAFYQAIGFTPSRITQQYEQNRAVKNAEQKILDRRGKIMDKLFLAMRNEDQRGVRESMQSVVRFNKKNPAIAIDASNIVSSAKNRARYSAESVGGVTLNRNLRFLNERLRFTPKKGESE